jgi:hypothetical protein
VFAAKVTAVGFMLGCMAHTTGLVLLGWGVELYGRGYPAWRHAVMATVDAMIASTAIWRPAWLAFVLPAFIAEQLLVNGMGWTPVVVLIAWIAVCVERFAGLARA